MDSTTSAAHRRVGAAAVLAFLALLLLGLTRNSAAADPVVPVATPTVESQQPVPQEQQVPPLARPRDRDGFRGGDDDGGRGFGGGGAPGGGQTAPTPSTGGSDSGTTT
jgi:hypothetical protein